MTEITVERWWPYVAAAVLVVLWWYFDAPFPGNREPLMAAAVTVAAVLGGFLGTSKAIILGLKGSRLFRQLETTGFIDPLFDYLKAGVTTSLVFICVSTLGFFALNGVVSLGRFGNVDVFAAVWLGCGLLALFCYLRISNVLFKLLRHA